MEDKTEATSADEHDVQEVLPHDESSSTMEAAAAMPSNLTVDEQQLQFHYGHHMLTAFKSECEPAAHTRPTSPQTQAPTHPSHSKSVAIGDLFDYHWPSNFSIWEAHTATLLLPWINKCFKRGGHAQSHISRATLRNIIRATAWLQVFGGEHASVTLGELAALAREAVEAEVNPDVTINEKLKTSFDMLEVVDKVSKRELYSGMLNNYQEMCKEGFGHAVFDSYLTEDEHGSDPGEDSAEL